MVTELFENIFILIVVLSGFITVMAFGLFCANRLFHFIRDRRAR